MLVVSLGVKLRNSFLSYGVHDETSIFRYCNLENAVIFFFRLDLSRSLNCGLKVLLLVPASAGCTFITIRGGIIGSPGSPCVSRTGFITLINIQADKQTCLFGVLYKDSTSTTISK